MGRAAATGQALDDVPGKERNFLYNKSTFPKPWMLKKMPVFNLHRANA
jgi:hypothetical protein